MSKRARITLNPDGDRDPSDASGGPVPGREADAASARVAPPGDARPGLAGRVFRSPYAPTIANGLVVGLGVVAAVLWWKLRRS